MKIRIITSCTGDKIYSPENQLKQSDFYQIHTPNFKTLEAKLDNYRTPADTIYSGMQHVRLMEEVNVYRQDNPGTIDLWILSAGYGLIPGDMQIVPYECTFQGMKLGEIKEWAKHLNVPIDIRNLFAQPADLTIVMLGESYLKALNLDEKVLFASPTLFFTSSGSQKQVKGEGKFRTIPLTNNEARRFSCALVGLKGELVKLLLIWLQEQGPIGITQLFESNTIILNLLADLKVKENKITKMRIQPNKTIDQVIQIPDSWWQKPHRAKLRYFIPEWDDLVDPDYDFESDEHSGGMGDWSNQVYAHQMYPEPNYDGILISKVIAEKSKKKKERINAMGVHRYLRVPRNLPIMGDCGAFGYVNEDVPPYTTNEILDYYTRLDFDFGVSIDHLIFSPDPKEKKSRYDLTVDNAEEFLNEHRKRNLTWEPIGAVQGWDPKSYAEAARKYVSMGYKYIGLGGMVRTPTKGILQILDAVHEAVPPINIHLFGIARFREMNEFIKRGATSVDSASVLRRAWLGSDSNYLSDDGWYSAIRVPQSEGSFRAINLVKEGKKSLGDLKKLEKSCLDGLRNFAASKGDPSESLISILEEYDVLIAGNRQKTRERILRTLSDRPWEKCECSICQRWGIEVAIFRGNNRNRRRGFHNTFVFYNLLQQIIRGEKTPSWLEKNAPAQEQVDQ